jgi:hypothetical protein
MIRRRSQIHEVFKLRNLINDCHQCVIDSSLVFGNFDIKYRILRFSNRQTRTCREGICQSTCDPFERCIYLLRTSHSSHIFDNPPRFQSSFVPWPISSHVLLQCGHCAQLVRRRAFLRALNDAQNDFGSVPHNVHPPAGLPVLLAIAEQHLANRRRLGHGNNRPRRGREHS